MQIQVFKDQELVFELVDDDTNEIGRVRQEIDLLTHAVKTLPERVN